MCTSPLSFDVSKRLRYFDKKGAIPTYIDVPCGHCYDCVSSRRNGFYLRTRQEYYDCVNAGGKVAFLTFTYSDDNIPRMNYVYNSDSLTIDKQLTQSTDFDLYCFNRNHLKRFFNSLRKFYERKGFVNSLRYIVTSEYGADTRYTQRPHYHALLFLNSDLCSYYDNFNLFSSESRFLSDIRCYWHYGFVSPSKMGLFLDNDFCCSYIAKYIGKGSDLFNNYRFSKFRDFVSEHISELSPSDFCYSINVDSLFRYFMRKFDCRCFTFSSKGFGLGLLRSFSNDIEHSDYESVYNRLLSGISVQSSTQSFVYNYPRYILHKLMYRLRSDGSRYLTSLGVYLKGRFYFDSIVSFIDDFNNTSLSDFFNYVSSESRNSCILPIIKNALDSYSLVDICLYRYFIQGRRFYSFKYSKVMSLFNNPNLTFKQKFSQIFSACLPQSSLCAFVLPSCSCTASDFFEYSSYFYTKPVHIECIDYFLSLYSSYCNYNKSTLNLMSEEEERKRKLVSDILNFNLYGV